MSEQSKAERDYVQGARGAWITILNDAIRHLHGFGCPEVVTAESWRLERAELVAALRDLCEDFGDNDWPDDLYLPDVVEKHLARHLHENCVDEGEA